MLFPAGRKVKGGRKLFTKYSRRGKPPPAGGGDRSPFAGKDKTQHGAAQAADDVGELGDVVIHKDGVP